MQPEYLARLSESVQFFVLEVEKGAGIDLKVIPDPNLNEGGPTGQGNLAVVIRAQSVQLFVPTNGYFPDGAVLHEVLHVRRFHIEGVPKLVLADNVAWDQGLSDALGALDNAIEHMIIVPVEIRSYPERRNHWETMLWKVCLGLPSVPEGELRLAVCLHWTFLRHVLPDSPPCEKARKFAEERGLLEMAEQFADRFISVLASKEELVRLLFSSFPEIPKNRAALDYISSRTGICQKPIP